MSQDILNKYPNFTQTLDQAEHEAYLAKAEEISSKEQIAYMF